MKAVATAVSQFTQEDIQTIEQKGEIAVVINEKNITLGLPDVEISSQDIEGWLVANNGPLTVALDVNITPELKSEGIARELVNRIQNVRKDSGFEVTDKVSVTIQKAPELEAAVAANLDYIKTETLTASLEFSDDLKEGTEVAFDDIETRLAIKKY
jgi:isoleucyl-tRNA synthetase